MFIYLSFVSSPVVDRWRCLSEKGKEVRGQSFLPIVPFQISVGVPDSDRAKRCLRSGPSGLFSRAEEEMKLSDNVIEEAFI